MKKILLLAAAALIVVSADAQTKRSETTQIPARPHMQLMKPEAKMEVAQKRIPGMPVSPQAPLLRMVQTPVSCMHLTLL